MLWQRKSRISLCNPILIAAILVLLFLKLNGLDVREYQADIGKISWLMTPATISLAIPMYEKIQDLRKNMKAILMGIVGGTLGCLMFLLAFTSIVGLEHSLTVSLLPKSVTTAIGVPLSELSGGIPSITTAAIILTGIIANVLSSYLFSLFRLKEKSAQGVALGTSGHIIATAAANELDPLTGVVSSFSLVVSGLLTAILFPIVLTF